jgi:hypothetical protein
MRMGFEKLSDDLPLWGDEWAELLDKKRLESKGYHHPANAEQVPHAYQRTIRLGPR